MRIRSRAWFAALSCLTVFAVSDAPGQHLDSLLVVAQTQVDEAETISDQVRAFTHFAHILNRADRHTEALDVVSEAAQLVGIPPAIDVRPNSLPDSLGNALDILLVRAVAHEGLSQFAEARNDLSAFLSVEPSGLVASMARARSDTLELLAIGDRATLARFDPDELSRFHDQEKAAMRISVLPFLNTTETLLWNWVGYGLSGYLHSVFSELTNFVDPPVVPSNPINLSAALNSVSLGRIYSEETPISEPQMGMVLGSQFLVGGRVSTGEDGLGLRIAASVGDAAADTSYALPEQRDSSLPEGIQRIQIDLAMSVVDQLQALTGFEFFESREAFADTIQPLVIPDLPTFVSFGRSVELALAGEFEDALLAIEDLNLPTADAHRFTIAEMRRRAGSSSVTGASFRDSIAVRLAAHGVAKEEQTVEIDAVASATSGPRASIRGRMLTMAGQAALGPAAVSDYETGAYPELRRLYGQNDPRDGIEGINRTQPGQVTVQIVIPVPPPGSGRKRP